ncbi:hypothetical protein A2U01_0108301, partial [Trifolium medium]|nr:hypothetical protein [Trifolium medium]
GEAPKVQNQPVGICLNLDDANFFNLVLSLARRAVAMALCAVVFWLGLVCVCSWRNARLSIAQRACV